MSYLDQVNKKTVLEAIGLAPREETVYMSEMVLPSIALFGAGLLVGAGVALLLAPKSGKELRDDLQRKAGEIGDTVKNRLPALPGRNTEENGAARSNGVSKGNPLTTP